MLTPAPRQVKFMSATIHRVYADNPSQRTVTVRLERNGEQVVGRSSDGHAVADLHRAAEAALDALAKMAGGDVSLVLRDVAPVVALRQSLVMAVVETLQAGRTTTLVGVCRSSLDAARDGAMAVLDAVNRRLGSG